MGSKVFIANRVSSIIYTSSDKYGEPVTITEGYVKFDNVYELSQRVARLLLTSSVSDYLVLSGNNLVCSMVFFLWMKRHGVCNILHWDRDRYVLLHMTDVSLPILL